MFQQYYKYIPSVVCLSILLFLAFGEKYISTYDSDSKMMQLISQRREQLMVLFGVLTGVSYYYLCHKPAQSSKIIKLPSYEESMSQNSQGSYSTSVTNSK